MAYDLAQFVAATLREDEAICALVMEGTDGILETGDPSVVSLEERQAMRRTAGNPAKVLAITVQDAGEKATDEMTTVQQVILWIWDRQRGYANIRLVVKAIYAALEGKPTLLQSPITGRTTAVRLDFYRRTGHLIERSMEVDVECMIFQSIVTKDLG